jgi:hypothetical protein
MTDRRTVGRLVVVIGLLAASCADRGDRLEDVAVAEDGETTAQTIQAAPLPDAEDNQSGDQNTDAGQDEEGSADGDSDSGGDTAGELAAPDPSICGISQVNGQRFYAVANIEEDDPDGGLNLRSDYQRGLRVSTLPEETIVLAEDCIVADDGGTWFAVETLDGEFGWVNAAFLSTEISPLLPTFGGQETELLVTSVLDALAARKWEEAADLLAAEGDGVALLNDLLERGAASDSDFPALLEGYCQVRLCDAPYSVVETRGSYYPERVRPEVDVRFDYPSGSTVETFARVETGGGQTLDVLPGQSNLAWTVRRQPAENLVAADDITDPPDGLLDAAESIRQALLSENGSELLEPFVPAEGVTFSSDAYVAPEPELRQKVRGQELLTAGDQPRIWGYQDGIGTAIVDTIDGWVGSYRRSSALLEPDVVGVDQRIGRSNTLANLSEVFPAAHVVEFHRQGRGQQVDFNWSSVRMALEQRPSGWVVVAITADSWTI